MVMMIKIWMMSKSILCLIFDSVGEWVGKRIKKRIDIYFSFYEFLLYFFLTITLS